MIQQTEVLNVVVPTCAICAWLVDMLPTVVAVLSIVLLSLQIGWFIWKRCKEWRKKK